MTLIGIARLTRVGTSSIVGLIVAFGAVAKGMEWSQAFLSAFAFSLIAACGFAANDVEDVDRDRLNKPWRAIPAGWLTQESARDVARGLSISALGSCVVLALFDTSVIWHLVALIGVLIYPLVVVQAPLAKGVVSGVISVMPLAFVLQLDSPIERPGLSIVAAAFAFILARELVLDVADLPGDLATSIRTLPAFLGSPLSLGIACALQFAAAVTLSGLGTGPLAWVSVALVLASATSVAAGALGMIGARALRGLAMLMWIPIMFGVAAFS